MPLTTGQVLQARYRIAALLGAGGMGAVYRAWDLRLDKPVALKEMVPQPGLDAPTLAQLRTQFRQEAVILGKLAHPHLVPVTDYFEEQGNDYLVMAFVEGEALASRIKREGALSETQVVAWARQLLDALAYCHRRGVIHRDIKPQNVVITPDGDAVLVDFGLVKQWDPADPQTRTVMRGVGTPEYAPPEQWGAQGQHTDPRSDLYSLGATLYHALTGQAPPTASDRMVFPKQFKTPRVLNGRVSATVDAALSRAMILAIDERWPDAGAMVQAMTPAIDERWPDTREMAQGLTAVAQPSQVVTSLLQPAPEDRLVGPAVSVPAPTLREMQPVPEPVGVTPEPSRAIRSRSRGAHGWKWAVGGIALLICLVGVAVLSGRLPDLWPGAQKTADVPRTTATLARVVVNPTSTKAALAVVEPSSTPRPVEPILKVGMVTDSGGIDDKSFNATSWRGVELAIQELGIDGSYLESQQQTDYATNLRQYVNQGADLIITVGYQLADDTADIAKQNPDISFVIVDHIYDSPIDNIRSLTFATDQAGFLAGYVAAAATKTGKVACFGGINIPPVAQFLVGYEAGVKVYNEQHSTTIEVLGWDTAANNGVFVGNFESTDDGRRTGEEFLAEGADVILPVAGPVGQGTAEAVKAAGNAWVIGVDSDWTVSVPSYKDIILTSILKNTDVVIYDAIKLAAASDFSGFGGETYLGTLANDGVGLADVAKGAISSDIEKELEDVRQGIIDGTIDTGWADYLANL